MFKTILTFTVAAIISFAARAQDLKKATFTLATNAVSYISMSSQKVFTGADAAANKQSIDLALVPTKGSKPVTLEWYNLSGKDKKLPKEVLGTAVKVVAISFDRDQFDQCQTSADLKRMAGYLTSNSFSHFAVIRNSADYYQHCFIIENENGKRGLLYVTINERDELSVESKMEE